MSQVTDKWEIPRSIYRLTRRRGDILSQEHHGPRIWKILHVDGELESVSNTRLTPTEPDSLPQTVGVLHRHCYRISWLGDDSAEAAVATVATEAQNALLAPSWACYSAASSPQHRLQSLGGGQPQKRRNVGFLISPACVPA